MSKAVISKYLDGNFERPSNFESNNEWYKYIISELDLTTKKGAPQSARYVALAIQRMKKQLGVPIEKPLDFVEDLKLRKLRSELTDLKKKYKGALEAYETIELDFNAAVQILSAPMPKAKKRRIPKTNKREAVPVIQWSDWHVGEMVNPKTVFNKNEYTPEIATKRAEKCSVGACKLIQKERKSVNINKMVLHLGGDFIGGWIHPELEQTNAMTPIEETIFATNLLKNQIKFLVKESDCEIVLICSLGNHGRMSPKMQFANEKGTNYETIIYESIRQEFPEMQMIFTDSSLGYYEILGLNCRFYHGQQVRYGGGIGGLTIPLNKKLAKWDQTIKAHYNFMGHYHTYSHPNSRTTLNGSLKGFDAYASANGFAYEPPIQSFTLIDSKYGVTVKCPIFC